MVKRSKIAFGILMMCFVFCLFMGLSGQESLNKMLGFASGDELVAVKPTYISIYASTTSVKVGSSIRITATGSPTSSSMSGVIWSTGTGNGGVRVSPEGVSGSTAAATVTGVRTGSIQVCASVSGVKTCKTFTVQAGSGGSSSGGNTGGSSSVKPTAISFSGSSSVRVGSSITLTGTVQPSTAKGYSVNWSTNNLNGALKGGAAIDLLGSSSNSSTIRVTGVRAGSIQICARLSTGLTNCKTINVIGETDVITCPRLTITSGTTKVFGASSSLDNRLSYSTSSPYLSISGNKITASGYLSSSRVEYVNVVSSSGTSKSCPVTVKPASSSGSTSTPSPSPDPDPIPTPNPTPTPPAVNSKITLSKYSTTLVVGATESLGYSTSPSGMGVRWKSTNPEVATVNNGVIRAVGVGKANVIAYSADSDSIYAICYVTVISNRVEVTGIQISPTTLNVVEGKIAYFNYSLVPTSATDQGVYFTSDNPNIATVNSAGLVTGIKEGRTTVTVSTKDGKKKSSGTVIVYPKDSKIETKPVTPAPNPGGNTTNNNNTTNITHTTTVILPSGSDYKSYDNTLLRLIVDGKNIYLGSYMPTVFVDNSVTEVKVEYVKSDKKSTVVVEGNKNLKVGNNIVTVTVTAEVGDVNVYRVVVVRRGKENNITSNVLTENKEVKIITTVAPVVDMETIEDVKDNNKTLIVLIQDNNGRTLYEWNVDGSYLTYVEGGLDTYITYLVDVPHPLNESITDKEASYLGFRQRGVLPSVAIINVYVGEKYADGTILNLYRYNEATSGVDYQYGNIKVSGGYIQLRIYDGAEYILTPNVIQTGGDMWIIYLGILLFILLICATVYMIYKDHRRKERW